MGISLITELSDIPLALWLGPALAVSGMVVLAGLLLEIRKFKVSSSQSS